MRALPWCAPGLGDGGGHEPRARLLVSLAAVKRCGLDVNIRRVTVCVGSVWAASLCHHRIYWFWGPALQRSSKGV